MLVKVIKSCYLKMLLKSVNKVEVTVILKLAKFGNVLQNDYFSISVGVGIPFYLLAVFIIAKMCLNHALYSVKLC